MYLSHLHLEAFEKIALLGSFSKAAKALRLTQPALSRRIQELEKQLDLSLFLRSANGTELTAEGQRLLKYTHSLNQLEEELFFDLAKKTGKELGGMIKITGYAAVLHPVIIPCLAPFLVKHPYVQTTCVVLDSSEIPELLILGQTDLAITDIKIDRAEIEQHLIGHIEFVLTESTRVESRNHTYLDTSAIDQTTEQFFKIQKKKPERYQRSFMHDEWGISIGTELGIGRAVKPRHMIAPHSAVRILNGYKPLIKPVYLQYRKQPYYTKLQQSIIDLLIKNAHHYLSGKNRKKDR